LCIWRVGSLHFVVKLRIQTVGFKQQFPVSQGTRTGLNRGILLGCGYAENGGVYLLGCEPSPTVADLELDAVPTLVIDEIRAQLTVFLQESGT